MLTKIYGFDCKGTVRQYQIIWSNIVSMEQLGSYTEKSRQTSLNNPISSLRPVEIYPFAFFKICIIWKMKNAGCLISSWKMLTEVAKFYLEALNHRNWKQNYVNYVYVGVKNLFKSVLNQHIIFTLWTDAVKSLRQLLQGFLLFVQNIFPMLLQPI